ncbi:MAG: hypothetical protein HRU41_13190 [Saprospiraceae bacterium]|nr:hypothetical protein [Saprospiraceae bacterium]
MTPPKLLSYLIIILVISTALFSSCEQPSTAQLGWQLVYRNGPDGEALAGEKADLLEAVRNGYPIRMGWGIRRPSDTTKSVEHVADAIFMTIANGTEVFAQSVQIIGQAPDLNGPDLKMRFREENQWVRMAGTNGYSTSLMTNFIQDTLVNYGQDRQAGTSWYVNYGILPPPTTKAHPLWD